MTAIKLIVLDRLGREVTPVLVAGIAAAFFLSRWSPLPQAWRSHTALLFSALQAIFIFGSVYLAFYFERRQSHLVELHSAIYYGSAAAFGLAFAMSHFRNGGRLRGCFGWLCAAFHVLVVLFTFSPPVIG